MTDKIICTEGSSFLRLQLYEVQNFINCKVKFARARLKFIYNIMTQQASMSVFGVRTFL